MKTLLAILALLTFALAARATVLDDYTDISTALSKDDLSAAQLSAIALAKSNPSSPFYEPAMSLAKALELTDARQQFKILSTLAIPLAKKQPGYHTFTCPMVHASWIARTREIKNPYMGKAMLDCGTLDK